MILALGLLVAGLAVVLWRPCRWAQGRAPRSAVALLLAATAGVWIGSLAMVVGLASGELGGTLAACGVLWRRLLGGQLGWWQTAALALWAVALPARGVWSLAVGGVRSRRLLRKLAAAGMAPLQPAPAASGTFVVSGLSTTAVTLGMLRPLILVDGRFWRTATPLQRQVVVAHEEGHRRGRHVLVDGAARALTAGLAPLPAAGRAYQWVRRQLEA
ncbi:MAG: hypothetical protein M3276_00275, partial [Actinomycetota bacterium]|nr:hypothetical protein [Actinomycetota bacterium]